MKNADEFDDLFRASFEDAEMSPDIDLWKTIQNDLNFESAMLGAFETAELTPSEAVWSGIGESLGSQQVRIWQNIFSNASLPVSAQVWANIEAVLDEKKPLRVPLYVWLTAAACLLFTLFVWFNPFSNTKEPSLANHKSNTNTHSYNTDNQNKSNPLQTGSSSDKDQALEIDKQLPSQNNESLEQSTSTFDASPKHSQTSQTKVTTTESSTQKSSKLNNDKSSSEKANSTFNSRSKEQAPVSLPPIRFTENPDELILTSSMNETGKPLWISLNFLEIGQASTQNPDFVLSLEPMLFVPQGAIFDSKNEPNSKPVLRFYAGLGAQAGIFRPNLDPNKALASKIIIGSNVVNNNLISANSLANSSSTMQAYGVDFGLSLGRRFFIESGLALAQSSTLHEGLTVSIKDPVAPLGSETVTVPLTMSTSLRSLQIPVLVGLNLGNKRIQTQFFGGLQNDFLLNSTFESSLPEDFNFDLGQAKSLNHNAVLGVGLAYNLNSRLSLGVRGQYVSALQSWLDGNNASMKPEQTTLKANLIFKF
ncbi:MAG: hypothetical protein EAZ57_09995 [Cytophagales bacterium]|nr:MAG: hypothetical protein EAZ67_10475 [Cytophagales bacterium]TAF59774.1 MAG: hypothetical protein EAZ57_09995 [Cytophagales bacterium]